MFSKNMVDYPIFFLSLSTLFEFHLFEASFMLISYGLWGGDPWDFSDRPESKFPFPSLGFDFLGFGDGNYTGIWTIKFYFGAYSVWIDRKIPTNASS